MFVAEVANGRIDIARVLKIPISEILLNVNEKVSHMRMNF